MISQRGNYQLAAITLGMILLGGTILGSTPFAFADDHDDKKEKLKAILKKLLEKIRDRIQEDNDGDCKGNHYGDICDNKRPSVDIKEPDRGDRLQAGVPFTFEIKAKDKQTGIDKVEVFINNVLFGEASLVSGDKYELEVELNDKGRYKAKVIATDNAGNTKSDRVSFRIV